LAHLILFELFSQRRQVVPVFEGILLKRTAVKNIIHQTHQLPGEEGLLLVLDEQLADPLGSRLVDMGVEIFQSVILVDPFAAGG
jgi:hypothetical protein